MSSTKPRKSCNPCCYWNLRDASVAVGIWSFTYAASQIALFSWQISVLSVFGSRFPSNYWWTDEFHKDQRPSDVFEMILSIGHIVHVVSDCLLIVGACCLIGGANSRKLFLFWPWFPAMGLNMIVSAYYCVVWWLKGVQDYYYIITCVHMLLLFVHSYCFVVVVAAYRELKRAIYEPSEKDDFSKFSVIGSEADTKTSHVSMSDLNVTHDATPGKKEPVKLVTGSGSNRLKPVRDLNDIRELYAEPRALRVNATSDGAFVNESYAYSPQNRSKPSREDDIVLKETVLNHEGHPPDPKAAKTNGPSPIFRPPSPPPPEDESSSKTDAATSPMKRPSIQDFEGARPASRTREGRDRRADHVNDYDSSESSDDTRYTSATSLQSEMRRRSSSRRGRKSRDSASDDEDVSSSYYSRDTRHSSSKSGRSTADRTEDSRRSSKRKKRHRSNCDHNRPRSKKRTSNEKRAQGSSDEPHDYAQVPEVQKPPNRNAGFVLQPTISPGFLVNQSSSSNEPIQLESDIVIRYDEHGNPYIASKQDRIPQQERPQVPEPAAHSEPPPAPRFGPPAHTPTQLAQVAQFHRQLSAEQIRAQRSRLQQPLPTAQPDYSRNLEATRENFGNFYDRQSSSPIYESPDLLRPPRGKFGILRESPQSGSVASNSTQNSILYGPNEA